MILIDFGDIQYGAYPTTLFRTEEAFVGPCTAKTTIYCANIAAGLMVAHSRNI